MALIHSIATVGGYTMVSRVLGFVRDILIAAFLGAGPVADAFFVAFKFPNLFRRIIKYNSILVLDERLEGYLDWRAWASQPGGPKGAGGFPESYLGRNRGLQPFGSKPGGINSGRPCRKSARDNVCHKY